MKTFLFLVIIAVGTYFAWQNHMRTTGGGGAYGAYQLFATAYANQDYSAALNHCDSDAKAEILHQRELAAHPLAQKAASMARSAGELAGIKYELVSETKVGEKRVDLEVVQIRMIAPRNATILQAKPRRWRHSVTLVRSAGTWKIVRFRQEYIKKAASKGR